MCACFKVETWTEEEVTRYIDENERTAATTAPAVALMQKKSQSLRARLLSTLGRMSDAFGTWARFAAGMPCKERNDVPALRVPAERGKTPGPVQAYDDTGEYLVLDMDKVDENYASGPFGFKEMTVTTKTGVTAEARKALTSSFIRNGLKACKDWQSVLIIQNKDELMRMTLSSSDESVNVRELVDACEKQTARMHQASSLTAAHASGARLPLDEKIADIALVVHRQDSSRQVCQLVVSVVLVVDMCDIGVRSQQELCMTNNNINNDTVVVLGPSKPSPAT